MIENTRLLKPEELREITERERKATPGPWSFEKGAVITEHPDHQAVSVWWNGRDRDICLLNDGGEYISNINIDEDALFIAASRTDIPRLLAHIEALQAQLSSLCSIGDLGVITSLQTNQAHMAEHIKAQQAEIERYKTALTEIVEDISGYDPWDLNPLENEIKRIAKEAL
ncbi:hypothetical protein [Aneurinibacillus aneurinilyticus]|uniref:hypothetical protein n=1 Tax=Aneurinibacillus aneurinilyticus TaxID=1391 RepID=UPI0023F266AC|nr:hypothetical protein [Aneurinibacillus aneurinilyticus]